MISSTVLNKNGGNGYPYLVPDFGGGGIESFPIHVVLTAGFLFFCFKYIPCLRLRKPRGLFCFCFFKS